MTNTSKLAMLTDELREAGASSAEIAELVLAVVADLVADPDKPKGGRKGAQSAMVRELLCASIAEGFLDRTPWRE